MEPLVNDRYTNSQNDRALNSIIGKRNGGAPVVGMYCGYAPVELVRTMGAVPVFLCASSRKTIEVAEAVLPLNLFPLIKSSFGFIQTDSCPFYALSEAIIGETNCDGKKKMFELISHIKPTHIMDLPQLPDEAEALEAWTTMVHKLKFFLEKTFGTKIINQKNRLMNGFFTYAAKVFRVIEEAGGAIVAMEACSGMKKGYSIEIEENTGDPISALAKAYLKIPCSCMTSNQLRFDALDEMIDRFKPDAVIDVILQACHSYNTESYRIGQHVRNKHHLPS
ncbi:MAG: 2-hydroxyglutaryl-CoA dehydratase, D-component [Syntrophorhabdus sp. PtaB.Bin006]|nr:MAG: 2-hydroxyglutaryl-CoA dehydratase, D-component [Syntrophorhabdus sp. PtaB.Bin006]